MYSDPSQGGGCQFTVDLDIVSERLTVKMDQEGGHRHYDIKTPRVPCDYEAANLSANSGAVALSTRSVVLGENLPASPFSPLDELFLDNANRSPSSRSMDSELPGRGSSGRGIRPKLNIPGLPRSPIANRVVPGDALAQGLKMGRALIVDDVASNRKMLGRVVLHCFHTIDYAVNGTEAVEKVTESEKDSDSSHFNVIFMDYNMPGTV